MPVHLAPVKDANEAHTLFFRRTLPIFNCFGYKPIIHAFEAQCNPVRLPLEELGEAAGPEAGSPRQGLFSIG